MPLPERTEAQRAADLKAATEARHQRALIQSRLKDGEITLADVLAKSDDPIVARMKVSTLIEALPGYGKARTAEVMDELGISPSRRIQGLGVRQRAALLERFGE